jgi:hypothetical protein
MLWTGQSPGGAVRGPGDSTLIHPSAKRSSGPPGLCPGGGLRPGGEVQAEKSFALLRLDFVQVEDFDKVESLRGVPAKDKVQAERCGSESSRQDSIRIAAGLRLFL